ncbi:hypothetical protein TNCV_11781 [Trichonephila clavipes]|nr:hypothetical protein TNCV_11781 [Trichonephila clavipes]
MIDSIVKDRIRTEEKKRNCDEKSENMNWRSCEYRLKKNANTMNNPENVQAPKVIHETFHKFNMKDDISLNLTLFERHAENRHSCRRRIGTEYPQGGSNRREENSQMFRKLITLQTPQSKSAHESLEKELRPENNHGEQDYWKLS